MMDNNLRTMLITGTTKGIGYHLYNYFYDKYNVITVNRRDFKRNNLICDLEKIEEVCELAKKLADKKIDILINNAGGAQPVLFSQMRAAELLSCSNLNYHAPVLLMQAVIGGMADRGFGKIINISSIAAKSPRVLTAHYGAAKSALEKFSASMAVAYQGTGVSVNCICPGGINTETSIENRRKMASILHLESEHFNHEMETQNGLGTLISPFEIVKMVEFLLSDDSPTISGQTFNICGVREVHS